MNWLCYTVQGIAFTRGVQHRMKLAINYSPQTADLLASKRVEFDLYKTTEWPDMIAAAEVQRPAYVHFPLMAGRHNINDVGPARIKELLATTATPYVNTH